MSFEKPQFNPHNVDLRTIDNGRLISPSKAEGENIHNLKLEGIEIPVSFSILPSGHFRLNGMEEALGKGLVMSGFISNTEAKINHVVVDTELRKYARENGNLKIGESALADLEENLNKKGIKTIYSIFYTPETIEFFRRNGYDVASVESLSDNVKQNLGIDPTGFKKEITNNKELEKFKESGGEFDKHVLLEKHLKDLR